MRFVVPKRAEQIKEASARRIIEGVVLNDWRGAGATAGTGGKAPGPLPALPRIGSAQVESSFTKSVVGKRSGHMDRAAVILERCDDVRQIGPKNVPLHIQP